MRWPGAIEACDVGAAAEKSPLKLVSVSAEAGSPGQRAATATRAPPARQSDAEVLAADFPDYDASLIACMLQDQGGDVRDVRYALQVSRCHSPPLLTCMRLRTRRLVRRQFVNKCSNCFERRGSTVMSARFVCGEKLRVATQNC